MKQMLLALQLLKTNWKSYLVLVLQLVISMLLFTILCCTLRYYGETAEVVKSIMDPNCIAFGPFFSSSLEEDIVDGVATINHFPEPVEVDCDYRVYGNLREHNKKSQSFQMFAYTSQMVRRVNISLTQGEWFTNKKLPDGSVPAVVLNNQDVRCGDQFTLDTKHNETFVITVVGTKRAPAYYYSLGGFSSSYSHYVSQAQDMVFILPYGAVPAGDGMGYSAKIYHAANAETAQRLKQVLSEEGYVYDAQTLKTKYEQERKEDITYNAVMFTLFSLLTFAGFCGINGLQDRKNRRKFAAYYMTGQTKKQAAGIEALRSGLVLAVSCALYAVIFNLFSSGIIEYPNVNEYMDIWTGTAVVGFAFVLYLASSLPFIIRAAKRSPVEQIREWGE